MNDVSANVTIGSAVTTANNGIRVTNPASGTNTFSGVHLRPYGNKAQDALHDRQMGL